MIFFWLCCFLPFTIAATVKVSGSIDLCATDAQCAGNHSCVRNICTSPNCLEVCGPEALCVVMNHEPFCFCRDNTKSCIHKKNTRSCVPECEKNSVCNPNIGYCECKNGYSGNPYKNCLKKCKQTEDCPSDERCTNGVCKSPCEEDCGINAVCLVKDHNSICSCPSGYSGNAFEICRTNKQQRALKTDEICDQCAQDAVCITTATGTNCACLRGYSGNPFRSCDKICLSNDDCKADKVCVHYLCKDPCEEACGVNANCILDKVRRKPVCTCKSGFTGDPSRICTVKLVNRFGDDEDEDEEELECHPTCGHNATCDREYGTCKCNEGFTGNPYGGCHKKCKLDDDCDLSKVCIAGNCTDPCHTACGKNAECSVYKRFPFCKCPDGFSGNPYKFCKKEEVILQPSIIEVDLCDLVSCGTNAKCEHQGDSETCLCLPGHRGNPYKKCYKKCLANSDCSRKEKCDEGLCKDVCENGCGINAICVASNHRPVCECPKKYMGDPLSICFPEKKGVLVNPSRTSCFKCICRAITGNDNFFSCAEKSINFGYWAFAGENLVGGEEFRTKNSTVDFMTCMNNRICILNTMNDYTSRALHRLNDIDCDGEITCADVFAVHKFGLIAKFPDSLFSGSEARSFDQCEGHGEKDISGNWTPRTCVGPSYVELLS